MSVLDKPVTVKAVLVFFIVAVVLVTVAMMALELAVSLNTDI